MVGPQGVKLISSRANSLPQPAAALLIIFKMTVPLAGAGNVKFSLTHVNVLFSERLAVVFCPNKLPCRSVILKVSTGSIPLPLQPLGFKILSIHASVLNMIFGHKPLMVSRKIVDGPVNAFIMRK